MENIKINSERRLITSALPYVNNIPHLGNLIQMLSADVFARFCRLRGYETLYICGTDEYGTATETKAKEEGISPKELCDYYYKEHEKIYKWFNISFDKFGRTSNKECTEATQSFFNDLDKNGFIKEHESKQLFCPTCNMFLADRYIHGTCPKCGYLDAKGDQCDKCGALLTPLELKDPKCTICSSTPFAKSTTHLYIDLPAISEKLKEWVKQTSEEGKWSDNAIKMTEAWIRDGLEERAITRDLKWGIQVPKEGYEGKVFYVWFNAPIGYISITMQLANELKEAGKSSFDWKSWWLPDESNEKTKNKTIRLFQFIGKDNIPFHTVIFPCSEIGTGKNYTKLFHMSSTEYLNYEDGKFSKSRGIGVFGNDAVESGIKADAWRFFIFYNRPEKQDYEFTWKTFREQYNGELIGNLGNLVNRTLLFIRKYYDSKIPQTSSLDMDLWNNVLNIEGKVTYALEWAELKEAFRLIFSISDLGNKAFQKGEPWKNIKTNPEGCKVLLKTLCYVIKDLMIMAHPYMPQFCEEILNYFGKSIYEPKFTQETITNGFSWSDLGKSEGLEDVLSSDVFFKPLSEKEAAAYRARFSGTQSERETKTQKKLSDEEQIDFFNKNIELKVAEITKIDLNTESDKLYIETLDDGSGKERIIQSGLRPYVDEKDLLGKKIILVSNLKKRKIRGIESYGMLLAADYKAEDNSNRVEILEAPWANAGDIITLDGNTDNIKKPNEISIEDFSSVKIRVRDKKVQVGGKDLLINGHKIETKNVSDSIVH